MSRTPRKDIVWRDCTPQHRGGVAPVAYDVRVALTAKAKGKEPSLIGFHFRHNGADVVSSYRYMEISEIAPTSSRIYFNFMPDDIKYQGTAPMISKRMDGYYQCVMPAKNATEIAIIKDLWVGTYRIQYDSVLNHYYIELDRPNWR